MDVSVILFCELNKSTSDGRDGSGRIVDDSGGTPFLTRAASYTARFVVFVAVNIELGVGSESNCILSGCPNRE